MGVIPSIPNSYLSAVVLGCQDPYDSDFFSTLVFYRWWQDLVHILTEEQSI
ncbi:hypothetical protein LBR02_22390 [Levilactobacillus brevis]|nr:hypothetical protein LBR02_22390 [Levilactobacillus brevis]